MRRALALAALALALAPALAAAASPPGPVGGARASAIAGALPLVRREERTHPGSFSQVTQPVAGQWQVAFYSRGQEFVQVIVSASDGRVLGQYTGFQIAWTMARGYPGAFGRHLDALWIWLPLSLLFVLPFLDWRTPWRLVNLDLLALSFFSVSFAFFNHGEIHRSVPLAYPPLVYLLGRLLWVARAAGRRAPRVLRLNIPVRWLAVGVVALVAGRIALNVIDSNVIDVGFANVVGARKVLDGAALYGHFPASIARGDTYGPFSYEAYAPFVWLWGFSGVWDDLPAAHAAAIFYDLLCLGLLFGLGRRMGGNRLGVVLAYAWAAFPFTALALECNTNDALVAALILATLYAGGSSSARGALAALAGLTKFAPLALVPLLAGERWRARGGRGLALFVAAFVVAGALASVPALMHNTLDQVYQRTVAYQADRTAPFSIWGLYGGLGGVQTAVRVLAAVLACALAVVPRRGELAGLAAAAGGALIAVELGTTYWFYLYIPWFFGAAVVALLGPGLAAETGAQPHRAGGGEAQRRLALARLAGARR